MFVWGKGNEEIIYPHDYWECISDVSLRAIEFPLQVPFSWFIQEWLYQEEKKKEESSSEELDIDLDELNQVNIYCIKCWKVGIYYR